MKVYTVGIEADFPSGVELTRWEDICHSKEKFVLIHHDPFRATSGRRYVDRKRPYVVVIRSPKSIAWFEWSSHKTYDAALKAAKQIKN